MSIPAVLTMISGAASPTISNTFVNNKSENLTLQITGTYSSATVLVQGLVDVNSTAWTTLATFNLTDLSLTTGSGIGDNGLYQVAIGGILRVRLNVTAISGGEITITANFVGETISVAVENAEPANLIPVTAYDMAVDGGYTGTKEQFETDMGNSATNATNAAASAATATTAATNAAAAAVNFAPVYSASSTYAVGDYVLKDGVLYRCNTAITTAEAWTAAHWTQAKLGPDVADVNATVYSIYITENSNPSDWQQGWWGATTGAYDSAHNNAICTKNAIPEGTQIISCGLSYKMRLQAWEESTYKGIWNGNDFNAVNPNYFENKFYIEDFRKRYPTYIYKVVLYKADGTSNITTDDASTVLLYYAKISQIDEKITSIENSIFSLSSKTEESFETLNGTMEYTDKATWEVGSIYASGSAYDDSQWSIRTPIASKIFIRSGATVKTTNDLISTLYAFQYSSDGATFIGRLGESGKKSVSISTDGYYRFVLIKPNYTAIDPSDISDYSAGFSAVGNTLSEIMQKIIPENYNYHAIGKKIDLSVQGFNIIQSEYSLPQPSSIHEGLTARQDFDIYDGKIFQLFSDNYISIINLSTGSIIASFAINSGHGNSCQFSDEFYSQNDSYPLLYCWGYNDNYVYVNRITNSDATLIRKYKLETNGYRFSGGLDVKNRKLITIHYAINSSTTPTDNYNVVTVWDLDNVTSDSNNNLIPTIIKQTNIELVPVIQGCKWFKNALYVVSGYYGAGHIVKLTAFDDNGNIISEITDFPSAIAQSEGESISFYKTENRYKCYFATYILYELVFE